jgi:hypothetical protein
MTLLENNIQTTRSIYKTEKMDFDFIKRNLRIVLYANKNKNEQVKNLLKEKLPLINRLLYKYCPLIERNKVNSKEHIDYYIHNFKNDDIYFSDPTAFNDPFDCSMGYSLVKSYKKQLLKGLRHHPKFEKQTSKKIGLLFSDKTHKLFAVKKLNFNDFIREISVLSDSDFRKTLIDEDIPYENFIGIIKEFGEESFITYKKYFDNKITTFDKVKFTEKFFNNNTIKAFLKDSIWRTDNDSEAKYHTMLNDILLETNCNPNYIFDNEVGIFEIYKNFFLLMEKEGKIEEFDEKDFDDLKEKLQTIWKNYITEVRKNTSETIKITCFSERNDSSLMWSHYANKHFGFCIEYDFTYNVDSSKKDLQFLQELLFPVFYSNNRPIITKTMLDDVKNRDYYLENNIMGKFMEEIYCTLLCKSRDWAYEKEWRAFHLLEKNTLEIPCATKVFLGVNIEDEPKAEIISIAKNKNIPVYQMILKPNSYKFDCFQIK